MKLEIYRYNKKLGGIELDTQDEVVIAELFNITDKKQTYLDRFGNIEFHDISRGLEIFTDLKDKNISKADIEEAERIAEAERLDEKREGINPVSTLNQGEIMKKRIHLCCIHADAIVNEQDAHCTFIKDLGVYVDLCEQCASQMVEFGDYNLDDNYCNYMSSSLDGTECVSEFEKN